MKDNNSHGTSKETLGVWNDPELEARLIAMLLGELSAYEEAEMEQELERSPELRLFRDRMTKVMGLITEVNHQHADAIENEHDDDSWTLSPERRSVLLENFSEGKEKAIPPQASSISTASIQWRNIASIAACLLISLVAFMMMFVRKSPLYTTTEELVSYSAATEKGTEIEGMKEGPLGLETSLDSVGDRKSEYKGESVVSQDKEGSLKNNEVFYEKRQTTDLAMNDERVVKPEMSNEVAEKPSAPASSMAKVIAAGTPSPNHIPLPDVAVNEPSLDYGDDDAFGDSSGRGSGNRRVDPIYGKYTAGRRSGDFAISRENIDSFLNKPNSTSGKSGTDIPTIDPTNNTIQFQGKTYSLMDNGLAGRDAERALKPDYVDIRQSNTEELGFDELPELSSNGKGVLTDSKSGGIKTDLSQLSEADIRIPAEGILNANATDLKAWTGAYQSQLEDGKDTGRYAYNEEDKSEKFKSWLAAGQPSDSDMLKGTGQDLVSKEIARRELNVAEADKNLIEGRKAYQDKDYASAVDKYKEALDKLPPGPIAADRRREYTGHLLDGSVALSQQYRSNGRYAEAQKLLNDVLEKDPGNAVAKKQLEYLDDPIRTSPTLTYEHGENVEKVRKQLYTANSYYDQAQFDQAILEYKEVLKTDPYNKAATRGMEKVNAAKSDYYRAAYDQTKASMLKEVDTAWEIGVPPAEIKGKMEEGNLANDKQSITRQKLSNIQLPLVEFEDDATVRDAINFLRLRARELDTDEVNPENQGLNFALLDENIGDIKLGGLKIKDVPMEEALRQIAQLSGLRYKVNGDKIDLMAATDVDDNEMYTRTFRVSPDFVESLEGKDKNLEDLFELQGVSFPHGSTVGYSKERGTITVRNTADSLDDMENLVNRFMPVVKPTPDFTKEISASEQTHSTFSLNVSDVSYKLAKSVLLENSGVLEADKIRVEEFVNAFDYGDPSASDKKVNCVVEQCAHPFYQQRNLIRVGMKTGAMGRTQPLRLTVLLDNSGSMEREDRAATVVKAMAALASQLGPQDEVTLMSFARDARLLAQKVKGNDAMKLVDIVRAIPSEGGTNLSRAIEQAYGVAKQSVQEGTMSRIVVITDGAANLGNANPEDLAKSIEQMRQNGIAFDACGVGADGLDDDMLEALTRKGDGRYYFINRPEDADAGFAQKLAGALRPAAKNVKVQVVFNPERVGNYRLIGFEKHRLEKEDFRNDAVDAAEMAAEEAGNALYQVEAKPDGKGDVGTVFVRFRDMESGQMIERSWAIPYESNIASIHTAAPSMQLATAAGMLGERLKLGEEAGIDLKELNPIYGKLRSHYYADQEVHDLIRMCEKVISDQ
jgi:tetratricopeptide (TPR) repeat protein